MVSLVKPITDFWNHLIIELQDHRTRGWFMCGSPIPIFIILVIYYQIIKKIGPEYMKNRKPYSIDKIIQVYNLIQIVLCGWLAFESFKITFGPFGAYKWVCEPINNSLSPVALKVAKCTWIYYLIKIFDLLDTIFFVLRKKFNQASFLHVYHHMGVVILGYIAIKYFPDGHGFLLVPLNSFVHCFMYMYYFVTNYNPEYKKNIWWKKYITQIQLVQFLILQVHIMEPFFIPSCGYPLLPVILFFPQNILMLYLFSKFYKNAYLTPKTSLKTS